MENPNNQPRLRALAEDDRPREKLYTKGRFALSDAEHLAILLGSGTKGENAVQLSRRLLSACHNSLHELGRLSLADLKRFKGVGMAKGMTIIAAMELGRRRQLADLRERPKITGSRDAFKAIASILTDLHHEEFWLLMLNKANEIIARERISTGGMAGTVVDVKMVFKAAIEARASGIIAVHNHPSGNLRPSQADIDLTRRMRQAGELLDLPMVDHLIVSERGYYSFADEGTL